MLVAGIPGVAPVGAAHAEQRSLEAVGVVPVDPTAPSTRPRRDLAVRRALADAVWQVAVGLLPGYVHETDQDAVARAIGGDPLAYATRYQIIEDRGERPVLFSEDPRIESEYVVVVDVNVDVGGLRSRLVQAGLLQPAGRPTSRYRTRVVIEDIDSWAAYRAVRTLLEEVGVKTATPVEMVRGRAVLEVDGNRSPDRLMSALVRAAPPNVRIVPLGAEANTLRLNVRFLGAPAAASGADTGSSPGARN